MIQHLNDSTHEVSRHSTSWRWIAGINGFGALIAAGFAVASAIDPALPGGGSVTTLVRIYAGTYVVRAVPLAATLVVLLARPRPAPGLVPLLVIAGLAQAGDAVIGAILGKPAMLAGGALYAVIHLATAVWLQIRAAGTSKPPR
jgi:hypothetical protein